MESMLFRNSDHSLVRSNAYNTDDLELIKGKLIKKLIKKDQLDKFINVICTFDIETSTIKIGEKHEGFMYCFQFCIDGYVIFGRTWEEYLKVLEFFKEIYELNWKKRLIIYVHNLSYEFQFIYRFHKFKKVFSLQPHKVLYAQDDFFQFRCSYLLSNMNLEKFLENEKTYTRKGVDDLDYSVVRTPSTRLTEIENGYRYSDVRGLYEAIYNLLKENEDDLSTIPLTSTGYVRRDCRNSYYADGIKKKNRKLFKKLRIDKEKYKLLKNAFRGGDTGSNRFYTNQVIKNVKSFDITSSYPYQMTLRAFPMSPFEWVRIDDIKQLYDYVNDYCFLGYFTFLDIRIKRDVADPYISFSKCVEINSSMCWNGRVLKAESLTIALTEIDLSIICDHYDFKFLYTKEVMVSKRGFLPKEIVNVMYDYYRKKTELKGIEKYEYEYFKSKNKINSIYGMCATNILRNKITFNNETGEFTVNDGDQKSLDKYYKSPRNFLQYQWGVYVTSLARYQLSLMIDLFNDRVIYWDTDSVKVKDLSSADIEKIEDINRMIAKPVNTFFDINKKSHTLGMWENDGTYSEFKTLGAKKYCYKKEGDDKFFITVAGLSKKGGDEIESMEDFRIGKIFYNSGRQTAEYNNDHIHILEINDEKILTASNIGLYQNTYTLGMTDTMIEILDSIFIKRKERKK